MRRYARCFVLLLLCACGSPQPTPTATPVPGQVGAAPAITPTGAASPMPAITLPVTAGSGTPTSSPAGGTPVAAQVVRGEGIGKSTMVSLEEGMGFVRFTHQGQGYFTADLISAADMPAKLQVVEGRGARTVRGTFHVNLAGAYFFNVRVILAGGNDATDVVSGEGPLDTRPSPKPLPSVFSVFIVEADGPWTIEATP